MVYTKVYWIKCRKGGTVTYGKIESFFIISNFRNSILIFYFIDILEIFPSVVKNLKGGFYLLLPFTTVTIS